MSWFSPTWRMVPSWSKATAYRAVKPRLLPQSLVKRIRAPSEGELGWRLTTTFSATEVEPSAL